MEVSDTSPCNRTGRLESAFVLLVFSAAAGIGGGKSADWLSSGAVFLSFLCTQAAFDLAEEAPAEKPGSSRTGTGPCIS